jgi:hypothetical protein
MSYADVRASIRKPPASTSSLQAVNKCKRCANFEKLATISTTSCSALRRVARDLHRCNIESLETTLAIAECSPPHFGIVNSDRRCRLGKRVNARLSVRDERRRVAPCANRLCSGARHFAVEEAANPGMT